MMRKSVLWLLLRLAVVLFVAVAVLSDPDLYILRAYMESGRQLLGQEAS
jgi:hypothetical protein